VKDHLEISFSGTERILLNRHSAMGDVLKAFPFAKAFKETWPRCKLTWFVCQPWDELVRPQPYVDDVIVWEQRARNRDFLKAILEVRKRRFDVLVCLQGTDRGALLSLLSGIPVRIGGHRWANVAYTNVSGDPAPVLGVDMGKCERPFFYVPEASREFAKRRLEGFPRPCLAAVIGASKKVKRWPVASWIELARLLKRHGWTIVLIGQGRDEEEMAKEIVTVSSGSNIVNMVGKTSLLVTSALIDACDVALGGDTGLLHMAYIMDVPAVGLFGPTLPERVGLAGLDKYFISSCSEAGCERWDCPKKECLGLIDPKRVSEALLDLV